MGKDQVFLKKRTEVRFSESRDNGHPANFMSSAEEERLSYRQCDPRGKTSKCLQGYYRDQNVMVES